MSEVTRDTALNELSFRGISINAEADNVVTVNLEAYDSGIIFVNKETSADTTYTLPAVAEGNGKMWWFFNANGTKNIAITAPSNIMYMANTVVNTTVTCAAETGSGAFVFGDGTYYYFTEFDGTWTST